MDYWDSVLQEVMHKDDEQVQFRFTDLGRSLIRDRRHGHAFNGKHRTPAYYLGGKYGNLYFTKREAESLYYLLQGMTNAQVGQVLGLSARTIEFYLKNMKLKVGVRTKVELLELVRETELVNKLEWVANQKNSAT